MEPISTFQESDREIETYWRSIVLFGRNVASYKFALAKSLLELAGQGRDSVTLEELSDPFSRNICEHLKHSPRQATSRSSSFLDVCRKFNDGLISYDELISKTTKLGFVNVIDAFHVVNQGEIDVRFYEKDYSSSSKRIILTDEVFRLGESAFSDNLVSEAESRWNLVETAWEMGVSTNLLAISYEQGTELLTAKSKLRRKNITSARSALNGYQKGKCFYCYTGINASDGVKTSKSVDLPKLVFDDTPESYEYGIVNFDFGDLAAGETTEQPAGIKTQSKTAKSSPAEIVDSSKKVGSLPLCDIDHYFPHMLQPYITSINLDSIWNLVLACPDCNRGEGGKFARVPELKYLERLHRRNEYLISSHHPLRETIIAQTGKDEPSRRRFLYRVDQEAMRILQHRWSIEQRAEATF